MTKQVFISYSTADQTVAEEIRDRLERQSLACWMAPRDIMPGEDYGQQIINAIEATVLLVLVLSESSNQSIYVRNEVERAVAKGKVVIPFRIHKVIPSRSLEFFISSSQWIDSWEPPLAPKVDILAQAIRQHLASRAALPLRVEPTVETQQSYQRILNQQLFALAQAKPSSQTDIVVLVGRQREWDVLQRVWQKTLPGQAQLAAIMGEAGIGKTRLAEELLGWVERQGALTARTRAYAAQGALAYTPIMELLRTEALWTRLSKLEDVWLVEVARLLPELLTARPDLPAPQPMTERAQRGRFFEALARAVLAVEQPLALLFDDLQWCDQETLEWIQFLLHFAPQARLLIVGTVRNDEVDAAHPFTALDLGLRRTDQVIEIDLLSLTEEEATLLAAQIAGGALTSEQADQLYRDTEGNPLFVVEIVRTQLSRQTARLSMTESSTAPGEDDSMPSLPPKIHAAIRSRLLQLSPQTRELVSVAAVIGRSFSFEVLAAASNQAEDILVDCMDELWQRHIMRERDAGGYDFSHDKIREVVYAELSSVRQRYWHRRVGEALAAVHTGDPIASSGQVAAHFEKAGSLDQAFRYYVQAAAQAASLYAYQTAQELYGHAIGLAHKLNLNGEKLAEVYSARGRMLEHSGHYAEAVQVYHALQQVGQARHDRRIEGAAVVQLVKCYLEPNAVHDPAQAAPLLQRGISLARELNDPDLESQLLWSQLVHGSHYGADEEAQAAGEAGIAVARQHDLRERLAYILNDLAINLRLSGHPERGQVCADEARTLFREMGNLPMLADTLSQQAWSDYHYLHFDRALQSAVECIELSQEIHNGWNLSLARLVRAGVRLAQGAWGEALVDLEASQGFGEEAGFVIALTLAPALLGALLREIGQLDQAWTLHLQAHAVSTRQAPFLLHAIEAQLAMDAFATGQVAEGERWLHAMHAHQPRGAIARAWFTLADSAKATVASAQFTGDWTVALDTVEASLVEAQQRRLSLYLPGLTVLRGRCLTMLGRHAEAEASLQAVIITAQAEGLRPVLWQAHALLSQLYHKQSRSAEGNTHRTAAAEALQEIANCFADPAQRDSFLATPTVQMLLATAD